MQAHPVLSWLCTVTTCGCWPTVLSMIWIRKRIVANPGGGTTAITKANTHEYRERNREQARQAILLGIVDGTGAETWRGGVRNMAGAVAQIASDPKRGRAAVVAFETLLKMGDLAPDRTEAPAAPAGLTVTMSAEVARELGRLLAERRQGE